MNDARSPEDWGDAYADLEPMYGRFGERLEELLRSLLQDEEISYIESYWWTMESEFFVDEIYVRAREGQPVDDPLDSFDDLVGVTITTHTKTESESICTLVEREFAVDAEESLSFAGAEASNTNLAAGGRPGRVFYDHPRIVVSLTDERKALPEWREFEELRAEIRVQTLLQGVWKQIDEEVLPYIWDSSYPDAVQGVILRAASLVSEADAELVRIGDATSEIEGEYERALTRDELEGRLDVSALFVYVRDSNTIARLVSAAETAGMRHYPDSSFVSERHLWLVRHCGFNSVQELDAFIKRMEPRALDVYHRLRELVEAGDDFVPWAAPASVLEWLLLVLTTADANVVALTRYRQSIETAINTLIGNRIER